MKTLFALALAKGQAVIAQSVGGASPTPTWVERLGWMLIHSIWQFAVLAALATFVHWALRHRSANARYIAACALLGCVVVVPGLTWSLLKVPPRLEDRPQGSNLELLGGAVGPTAQRGFTSESPRSEIQAESVRGPISDRESLQAPPDHMPSSAENRLADDSRFQSAIRDRPGKAWLGIFRDAIEAHLFLVVSLWFAGIALFAMRPILGLWAQWRLRCIGLSAAPRVVEQALAELSRRLGVQRAIRIAVSARIPIPMAVGYLSPVILLPACVLTGLSAAQMEALLAHELAHIRRHDWLLNAFQVLAETLFFYHPAVWWLSRRIRREREYCCDDVAVVLIGDRTTFGRMLLALEELRQRIPEPALAATGGTLLTRIRRVLVNDDGAEPASRNWVPGALLLLVLALGSAWATWVQTSEKDQLSRTAQEPTSALPPSPPNTEASKRVELDRGTPPTSELASLIAKVREQEARLQNLDVIVKTTRLFDPAPKKSNSAMMNFGPSVLKGTEEINHVITQGSRYFFSGDQIVSLTTGDKRTGKQIVVCDGTQTVAMEEGNNAVIYHGRHEPALMVPPHCWGAFTLEVNFPLSIFLGGTEALKSHPKVRRYPAERGSVFEFYKVEAEVVGEEKVDDLDCVKVKVQRWYYTTNRRPSVQYLWLAKDRNYHVARCDATRVTKWTEVARGIWLPTLVTSESDRRQLSVEKAALDRAVSPEVFKLPEIPASLPKFVIGANGSLEDDAQHLRAAPADAQTTLDAILDRLAAEEARYDQFEVTTTTRYRMENASTAMSSGIYSATQSEERSVFAGKRFLFSEEEQIKLAGGETKARLVRQCFDGQRVREYSRSASGANDPKPQQYASLSLVGPERLNLMRPHATVFRGDRNRQSLSKFLRSGWFDVINKYKMTVEDAGDERAADLHCHKLKCTLDHGNIFLIWLARDRNLIVVRHEWRESGWSEKLPTSISFVEDLREIRPGLWFPYRTVALAFQKFGREGLCEDRLLLQWRRDIEVKALRLNPAVDDRFFREIEVPAGTTVSVEDEQGAYIGQFRQPKTGNIDIAPEHLLKLRQEVKINKEEADRRQKALDALIGLNAPQLPQGTWLNSEPLSWKQLAGKIVVVDFWAMWCRPCDADLERLSEIHKVWRDNSVTNLALIGIHTAGTDRNAVAKTVSDKKLRYPIIIDSPAKQGRAAWGDMYDKFAVHQIPMTFVIDASGKIVAHGRLEEMLSRAGQLAIENEAKRR